MKLKGKFNDPNNMVDYMLDTHDGQLSRSKMPATVAEEIAQRANSVELGNEKGFELIVNGDTYLPKGIFDFEDRELDEIADKSQNEKRKG